MDVEIRAEHSRLLGEIHRVWGGMAIPDWPAMEGDFEEAELSRMLSGKRYDQTFAGDHLESVFIWCRADVSIYYLGGYLLWAVDLLVSNPYDVASEFACLMLHSFLCAEHVFRPGYEFILAEAPEVIPVISEYGALLERFQRGGAPDRWMPGRDWPTERETIARIQSVWRDRESLEAAVAGLRRGE